MWCLPCSTCSRLILIKVTATSYSEFLAAVDAGDVSGVTYKVEKLPIRWGRAGLPHVRPDDRN